MINNTTLYDGQEYSYHYNESDRPVDVYDYKKHIDELFIRDSYLIDKKVIYNTLLLNGSSIQYLIDQINLHPDVKEVSIHKAYKSYHYSAADISAEEFKYMFDNIKDHESLNKFEITGYFEEFIKSDYYTKYITTESPMEPQDLSDIGYSKMNKMRIGEWKPDGTPESMLSKVHNMLQNIDDKSNLSLNIDIQHPFNEYTKINVTNGNVNYHQKTYAMNQLYNWDLVEITNDDPIESVNYYKINSDYINYDQQSFELAALVEDKIESINN